MRNGQIFSVLSVGNDGFVPFKSILSVFVPVGIVSRDFCTKVAFFLLNSRPDVRLMSHTTICN